MIITLQQEVKLIIVILTLLLITVTIVHVPHSDQQVSKIYYLSPRKVHLFGIQNEAVREQINYVLDEDEIIGKGPNGTLSMVSNGIKKLNEGEKYLKITCDIRIKIMPLFDFIYI